MLCDRCKKNEASMRVDTFINGKKTSLGLCMSCAAEIEMNIDFSKLLGSLLGGAFNGDNANAADETVCKSCGMSYGEFQARGRFGCSACYASFEPQTSAMLKSIHGSTCHSGKIPGKHRAEHIHQREMKALRASLAESIEKEEFEEAARLRDKIKALTPCAGNGDDKA